MKLCLLNYDCTCWNRIRLIVADWEEQFCTANVLDDTENTALHLYCIPTAFTLQILSNLYTNNYTVKTNNLLSEVSILCNPFIKVHLCRNAQFFL